MQILLLEKDKVVRDQILVGLQNFPDFAVECGEGFRGLSKTRSKSYDCLIIGCNGDDEEGIELLESFREYDRSTDVVFVTNFKKGKIIMAKRGQYNIFSVLHVPIEPAEFFRLVGRLRRRQVST